MILLAVNYYTLSANLEKFLPITEFFRSFFINLMDRIYYRKLMKLKRLILDQFYIFLR